MEIYWSFVERLLLKNNFVVITSGRAVPAEDFRQDFRVAVYRALLRFVGNGPRGLARPPVPLPRFGAFWLLPIAGTMGLSEVSRARSASSPAGNHNCTTEHLLRNLTGGHHVVRKLAEKEQC